MQRLTALVWLAVIPAAVAFAEQPTNRPAAGTVVRTLRLETTDVEGYRAALKNGRAVMRELGVSPEMRLEVTGPGRTEGTVAVRLTVVYPDRKTRRDWAARLEASERYRIWAGSLDALREVLSDEEQEVGANVTP